MSFTLEIEPGSKEHTCQPGIPLGTTSGHSIRCPLHPRSPGCLG